MRINARERRVLTIGGVVVAAVLIYYVADAVLPSRSTLAAEVANKKKTLLAERELVNQEAIFKTRVEQYQKRLEQDRSRLLPGDNPNVAGAELQRILKELADRNQVEITQKNFQREKKLDKLIKVPVQINMQCNSDQLVQFLAAIENYDKFLTVDELSITSFPMQRRFETRPSITVSGFITAPPEAQPGVKAAASQ